MMTQVNLARRRLNSYWGRGQKIMGAMHATFGRGLLVLLNGHLMLLVSMFFQRGKRRKRR
jgi:hypothetical protein